MIVENKGRHMETKNSSSNQGKPRKGISKFMINVESWYYGKKWHLKKDGWSQKGKQGYGQQESNKEANVSNGVLQYALIFSFHATPHRKYFLH